jgi:L-amino acid N-acyltransferase YncA
MRITAEELYKKFVEVSAEVREDFRRRGFIVPVSNKDGTISVGPYRIVKGDDNLYSVVDSKNRVEIDGINLPQTAIIMANDLALRKFLDRSIIKRDQEYGYALFKEQLYRRALQRSKNQPIERFDLMTAKSSINREKKERCRMDIEHSFEKLTKIL